MMQGRGVAEWFFGGGGDIPGVGQQIVEAAKEKFVALEKITHMSKQGMHSSHNP